MVHKRALWKSIEGFNPIISLKVKNQCYSFRHTECVVNNKTIRRIKKFCHESQMKFRYDHTVTKMENHLGLRGFPRFLHFHSNLTLWGQRENRSQGHPKTIFGQIICSEEDLRSRIFGSFSEKFIACLPLLGFSNFTKIV